MVSRRYSKVVDTDVEGTVIDNVVNKGWSYVKRDDHRRDEFLHANAIRSSGYGPAEFGPNTRIIFDVGKKVRDGKKEVFNVRLL